MQWESKPKYSLRHCAWIEEAMYNVNGDEQLNQPSSSPGMPYVTYRVRETHVRAFASMVGGWVYKGGCGKEQKKNKLYASSAENNYMHVESLAVTSSLVRAHCVHTEPYGCASHLGLQYMYCTHTRSTAHSALPSSLLSILSCAP